ncbi:MAG: cytidylate kinase-like family protein [Nitrospinae bacterium]|nr:cytidylate kinase-like family protein [Nitrospinota bacterium]
MDFGHHFDRSVVDLNFFRDWEARREARAARPDGRPRFVTLSREFGCQGQEIAAELMTRLLDRSPSSWTLVTRDMLEQMAASADCPSRMVEQVAEDRWSFADWFADALVPGYLQSSSSKVFERLKRLILNLADTGNVVFLEGGAQVVTARLDPRKFHGLHFRLVAPHAWRVHQVAEYKKIARDEAQIVVQDKSHRRDQFIRDFTGVSPDDPHLYHVIYNNARLSPAAIVDGIVATMQAEGLLNPEA